MCSRSISTGQSVSSHTRTKHHGTLPRMDGMSTNGWRQAENNVSFISRRVAFLASIWLFCSKLNSFCTRQGRNTQWEASAAAAHLTTDKSSPETMEGSSCTKKKTQKITNWEILSRLHHVLPFLQAFPVRFLFAMKRKWTVEAKKS